MSVPKGSQLLVLDPPYQHRLALAINVGKTVGYGYDAKNDPDDVMIVQRLIRMINIPTTQQYERPALTGKIDAVTCFWIFAFQKSRHRYARGVVVDGLVSPARGSTYFKGAPWTIIQLCSTASETAQGDYLQLIMDVSGVSAAILIGQAADVIERVKATGAKLLPSF